jgi:predicted outer membrane repeat protein
MMTKQQTRKHPAALRRMRRATAAVLTAVLCTTGISLLAAPSARAATITLGSCTDSISDAIALWSAILQANDETAHPGPDVIQLAAGCRIEIPAAYPGTDYAVPPITSAITIDGNGGTIFVTSQILGERLGFANISVAATLVLKAITVTNTQGFVDGSYIRNAGAVRVDDSTLGRWGGAIAGPAIVNLPSALVQINDSTVRDIGYNSATHRGGAVDNAGSMVVVNSEFVDNNRIIAPDLAAAEAGTFPFPAGVRNTGYLEIEDSSFRTSAAGYQQVALSQGIANTGDLVIRNTEFKGLVHLFGGAIHNSGTMVVERSSFTSNGARRARVGSDVDGGRGGAVYNEGTAAIENSVFQNNTATESGAAVYSAVATTVRFTSFDGNSAPAGGDVFNGNPLRAVGFAGTIAGSCSGFIADGGANLNAGAPGGCPGSVGDPHLTPRAYSGVRGTVLALDPGSDAIDGSGITCPTTDQRGMPRSVGPGCDIGAFENQLPLSPTGLRISSDSNPSNTGVFQLDWTAAIDPDADALNYRIYTQDFDDSAATLAWTYWGNTAPLSLPEGTFRVRLEAFDGFHASSTSATLTLTVDLTAPSNPTASPDRTPDYVAGDGTGWYADQVIVSFLGSTDPLLADTSSGSGILTTNAPQTFATSGEHAATGHATDRAGNRSADASLTVHVDADAPVASFDSCPTTVKLGNSTDLGWTASDAESGLASPSSGSVRVDTSTIGERVLSAAATDRVGHTTTATCTLHVVYDFVGFLAPVTNPPTQNTLSAGAVAQLSFGLQGNQGLGLVAAGFPVSAPIACNTNPPLTAGQATSATPPGLSYAPGGSGRYTYPWKTSAAWRGTCRQLILKLTDGTYHRANFRFK